MNQQPPKGAGSLRLGEALEAAGILEPGGSERVAAESARVGLRMGELLLAQGLVEERELYRILAQTLGLPFRDAESMLSQAQPELARSVPSRFQERQCLVPICREGERLVVATSEPGREPADLAHALGATEVSLQVVTPTDLKRIRAALELSQLGSTPRPSPLQSREPELLSAPASLAPHLTALFDSLLLDAIGERASDLHLERYGEQVRVRLRVDGDLRDLERYRLSPSELAGLINVVKVRSGLDIAERRLPQGGRFTARAGGRAYDLRVQTQPALHAEHAVLRLLPQGQRPLALEDLGFPAGPAAAYRRLLDSPQGLVLVVGPTGSGKSTTLYAGLQILARDATRKVISVEDPIEYAIDGVQQVEVRPDLGFGFAQSMRSFVRQDPDVILLGEVRDPETALEALRASQTGHLVLTTLHCSDAVDAAQRLLDLGQHPNSVAAELQAVFAQRLAKRICRTCRREAEPSPEVLGEVFPSGAPPGFRCYRGAGCDACRGAGTLGRIAVVEHLAAGPAWRRAVASSTPLDELRRVALASGLWPMRDQALALVQQGVISLEELPQLLPPERLAPEHKPSP